MRSKVVFKLALLALECACLGALVVCLAWYMRASEELQRSRSIPMELDVDLSHPGVYTGTYRQEYVPEIGSLLSIESTKGVRELPSEEGLSCTITISDPSGRTVYERSYSDANKDEFCQLTLDSGVRVCCLRLRDTRFPLGTYVFSLTVSQGASGLAGVPHKLVARYEPFFEPFKKALFLVLILICAVGGIGIGVGMWAGRKGSG